MRHILLILLLFILSNTILIGQLKTPQDYLDGQYGQQFTPHHKLIDYLAHVVDNSNRVKSYQYGQTEEGRPLMALFISNANNLSNIEDIRKTNLSNIGEVVSTFNKNEKSIVWLSFGVHGNEAGATESSMTVLFRLSDESNKETEKYLENTIVILDPCINPDGFSRYTHWVRGISGLATHPDLSDIEHMEPWPGGRVNHYFFDLNRDWAWQTQVETQQRIALYNQWMPHIHVDFHEMGYNDHYYFAPAAEPLHEQLTDFQRDFQEEIGKNHSKYFDEEGWLYFTREIFDLYYPSYGDTYPMFNGAIGMTYEKAGHGMAGRAIKMNNGDTLTLQDRIDQHTATALSTIEVASAASQKLITNFKSYFNEARQNPKGKFKSYVLKYNEKLPELISLLQKNGIRIESLNSNKQLNGFHYQSQKEVDFNTGTGDVIINVNQPKAVLAQVLLEPESHLSDSLTYDITSWSLPLAHGVDCYGIKSELKGSKIEYKSKENTNFSLEAYAYVIPWVNTNSAKMASILLKKNVNLRIAKKVVEIGGVKLEKGTLVASKADNKHLDDFSLILIEALSSCEDCRELKSGWATTKGGDLGGSAFTLLEKPKVMLLMGEGTSSNEVGQVWHFFEKTINYPLSKVNIDKFRYIDLNDYNTLILPDGWYRLEENIISEISDWVGKGGKVISIAGALNNFVGKEGFGLVSNPDEAELENDKAEAKKAKLTNRTDSYEDVERRNISRSMPGAIICNTLDTSHPLSYGLGEKYFSLKASSRLYALQTDMWNVAYVPKDYIYSGFIGDKIKAKIENTVSFAIENKGNGTMIYMVDNPLFRGFWANGNLLFSNALFLVD
jgi:hypothetical protein